MVRHKPSSYGAVDESRRVRPVRFKGIGVLERVKATVAYMWPLAYYKKTVKVQLSN